MKPFQLRWHTRNGGRTIYCHLYQSRWGDWWACGVMFFDIKDWHAFYSCLKREQFEVIQDPFFESEGEPDEIPLALAAKAASG